MDDMLTRLWVVFWFLLCISDFHCTIFGKFEELDGLSIRDFPLLRAFLRPQVSLDQLQGSRDGLHVNCLLQPGMTRTPVGGV